MRRPSTRRLAISGVIAMACASTKTLPNHHLATVQSDTSRPALPPLPVLPSDSTFTVESPRYSRSQLLYYRNIVGVVFNRSASSSTIRDLLARYQATIIGGVAGPADSEYILKVPDPGRTLQTVESLLARLEREPGVKRVAAVYYRTPSSLYSGDQFTSSETGIPIWPVLTNAYPDLDTSRVVRLTDDTFQVFRTDITLRFRAGVSDSAKRTFFAARSMTVLGVTQSGQFFVRIPDPGPLAQNLFAVLDAIRSVPGVAIVTFIPLTSLAHIE